MINNYDSVVARPYSATPHSQKQESTSYTPTKRTWLSLLTVLITLFCFSFVQGQIGVTVTGSTNTTPALSASYSTLAAALTDLNAVTAMSGPVVLTLDSGTSETAPVKGYVLGSATLNPVLSATNTITINKSGAGAVTINAGIGTAAGPAASPDGMFYLLGADYVTIDGLTFTDGNSASATVAMEFGVALFKRVAGDGCNNNTIQNCTFNMQRINNATASAPMFDGAWGIYILNSTATAATTVLTPTNGGTLATNGTNSNNKFYANIINGGNGGIALSGFAATAGVGPSPTATTFLGDINNDIGGTTAGTGNTILNFGGGAATNPSAGIRANNQWSVNVSNNIVNNNNGSGANHATTLRGIFLQAGTSANVTCTYNTVTIKGGGTTSSLTAIDNAIGGTALSNIVNINNNTVQNCTYATATTGSFTCISNSASASTVNINNNTIQNNSVVGAATTSVFTGIVNSGSTGTNLNIGNNVISGITLSSTGTCPFISVGSPGGTANVTNNTIQTITNAGLSGTMRGIIATTPVGLYTCTGNTIENLSYSAATSTGSIDGIYNFSSATLQNWNNNIIRNFSTPTTGTLQGIRNNTVAGTFQCKNNQIYNFFTTAGGAGGFSANGILWSNSNVEISGNVIYSLNSTGSTGGSAGTINGISSGGSATIYNNKIYDLSSTSTGPLVTGITISGGATNNIYNNLIGNLRATVATAATGTPDMVKGINITSTSTSSNQNVYNNTIYLNASSSGANFGTSGIFHTSSGTSTTSALDLQNNIIINTSTATGTGKTVAFRRSGGGFDNFRSTSNNNLFFAGVPSAANLIMSDNNLQNYQTISDYKNASGLSPRETNSFTESSITPATYFESTTGSDANYLQPKAGLVSQIEGGGNTIAITSPDYNGVTRPGGTGTSFDVGAWEFNGVSPAPVLTTLVATPALTAQCTKADRAIAIDVTTSSGTITSVTLNYSHNGVAQTPVTMTNSTGNTYTGTMIAPATGNATVTWSIAATNSIGLTTVYNGTSYADEPTTGITATATASVNPVCDGSPTSLSIIPSRSGSNSSTIGSGTTLNSTSSNIGAFYGTWWGNSRSQILIRASELTNAGLVAGNITALRVNITGGTPALCTGFNIKIASTSATSITGAFSSATFTNVFGPTNYTPTVGLNTHTFSTPFIWDGVSNIIVEYCYSNQVTGSSSPTNTTTTTAFASTVLYGADGTTLACGNNTVSNSSSVRPNIILVGNVVQTPSSVSWSDGSTVIGTTNPLVVNPTATTTYTGTATVNGCPVTATTTVTVNPLPSAPTATNSTQCGTQIPTASVVDPNAFTTPTFKWYDAATDGTVVQSDVSTTYLSNIATTTTFYVAVVNPTTGCESPRTAVTVSVSTPDAISATASSTSICIGQSVTLTAANSATTPAQTYAYSWLSAANSGVTTAQSGASITATPTTVGSYTYTVTAVDGLCQTTNSVTVTVNPLPVITTATASPNVACAGSTINLDATLNGISAGTSAPSGTGTTFTSSTGYPTLFGNYWYQDWSQMVYTAAELQAMGLSAGNITSLTFNMGAQPDATTINGYSIRLGATSNSVLTGFETTGLTTVLGPVNYTVPAIGNVTFNLTTPYVWDGTSNIIIDIRGTGGFGSANATTQFTATTGNTVVFANSGFSNNPNFWTSNPTATTSTSRPNVTFGGQVIANVASSYTWTWKVGTTTVLTTATGTAVVPTGATTTYTVTATNPTTGCSASQNVTVSTNVEPLAMFAIAPQASSICVGETVTMFANPTGGCIPYTYSWSDGTSVVGTASSLAVTPTSDKTYTLTITDNTGTQLVRTATVTVNNPQPASVAGQTICANNSAFTLSATESTPGNLLNWYAAQVGGSVLASGNTFTTPSISATTAYYVEENALGVANTGLGRVSTTATANTTPSTYGLVFNLNVKSKLNSVDVYLASATAGNLVVQLQNSAGTVINSKTIAVPAGNATTPVQYTVPLDFIIPTGTGYRLLAISGPAMVRESSLGGFPYSLGAFGNITGGYIGGASTTYYYFYNWSLSDICSGLRVPVTATLNNPPSITLSGSSATICNGQTTATPITVATGGSNYDVYTWSPSTGVTGNSSTGWTFNPTSTTAYTLTASQSAGTCSTTATYTVNVNPTPSVITIAPTTPVVCVNSIQALAVTGGTIGSTANIGTAATTNTTTGYPSPFTNYYGGTKHQMLIKASELTALGLAPNIPIQTLSFEVTAVGSTFTGTLQNFQVDMASTSATVLTSTAFLPATTNVRAAADLPVAVGVVTIPLNGQFTWDGVSNIVIQTSYSNANSGTTTDFVQMKNSDPGFVSTNWYRTDSATAASVLAATTPSGSGNARPNMVLDNSASTNITWSPTTNLYTDAAATTPYTGGYATTVYVKSATAATTTYTVSSVASTGCSTSATVTVTVNALPVVVSVNPLAVCSPSTVDLTASAVTAGSDTGLIFTYFTDSAATTTLTAPSAVTTSGTYYIKGTNANGCSVITPVTVTVNPLPVVTTVAPATVCYPNTVDLTAAAVTTGSASGLTFTYFTDSAATTALANPNAVTTSGTYYIKGTNANGCSSIASVVVTINVTNAPTGDATQTFCGIANLSQLQITGSGIRIYSAATGGTEYPQALWNLIGLLDGSSYFASQTINGCESLIRLQITVAINPIPSAPTATNQTFCGSLNATVSNLNASGSNLKWYNVPTGGIALAPNTLLVSGTYYVTQTSANCESNRTTVLVTVNDCNIGWGNLQWPPSGTINSCGDYTVYGRVWKSGVTEATGPSANITAWFGISTTNTDPSTWPASAWSVGTYNVQAGNNDEYQHTFSNLPIGTYYIATRYQFTGGDFWYGGYNSGGGGAWNGTTNVSSVLTVAPLAAPVGDAVQSVTVPLAPNATLANLVVSGTNVTWYPTLADAQAGTNALPLSTVLVSGNTYYAVSIVNGCRSAALAVTVTVNLDIREFDFAQLRVYPNPVIDRLTITFDYQLERIEVYNMLGQMVRFQQPNFTETEVDMINLPAATYIVRIYSNDSVKEVKVIKK